MEISRHLHKLSTSFGLLALGIGFAALGFLAFRNRHPEDSANGPFLDATYCVVGNLISILIGTAFLSLALLFTAAWLQRERAVEPKACQASVSLPGAPGLAIDCQEDFCLGRCLKPKSCQARRLPLPAAQPRCLIHPNSSTAIRC
jgi:hypothetical protein